MHILIVTDQHPESLGGVQVAIRLQRRFLEHLGHRVTIAAPALHRPHYVTAPENKAAYIDLPSRPITQDREYSLAWPTAHTDRALAAALSHLPPVDLVHVQGDFWGALIGFRAARGLGVPSVLTLHNNVDEGTRAVTRFAPAVFQGLRAWRGLSLGWDPVASGARAARPRGAWKYLAELAGLATVVTAPSAHFAEQLERNGVSSGIVVTPGGVDDHAVAEIRSRARTVRQRPRLVWLGRMSAEKRILEFIDALAVADVDSDVALHGAGLLRSQVRDRIVELGLSDRVTIPGPVPYLEALGAIHDADALVQTSIGFETQGLTPFEAAALGTPTVYSDPAIADDVAVQPEWRVASASVDALADTLRVAVGELAGGGLLGSVEGDPAREEFGGPDAGSLRVPEEAAQRFLQSSRSAEMLRVYERALGAE